MKKGLDDVADDAQQPPAKRIKLEQDPDVQLLSAPPGPPGPPVRKKGGRKTNSTSQSRALELLRDPRVSAVEPRQVLCRMCGNWVKLFKHTDYSAANWRAHAEKCEIKSRWRQLVTFEPDRMFALNDTNPQETSILMEGNLSSRQPVKSFEERKQSLEVDPRVREANAHGVLCGMCNVWVKLHNTRDYDLWNWARHAEKCEIKYKSTTVEESASTLQYTFVASESQTAPLPERTAGAQVSVGGSGTTPVHFQVKAEPDDSVSLSSHNSVTVRSKKKSRRIEERKKDLQDDPRCGEVRPHEVFCLSCEKWIKLFRDVAYIEANWLRHIERCALRSAESGRASAPTLRRIKAEISDDQVLLAPTPAPAPAPALALTPVLALAPALELAPAPATSTFAGSELAVTLSDSLSKAAGKRLEELRSDTRIAVIEPNRVLCKICNQWIKLQIYREYDTWNWRKHAPLCEQRTSAQKPMLVLRLPKLEDDTAVSLSAPAVVVGKTQKAKDERTAEERRDELLRDDRCEKVEPHRVFCKMCLKHIGLHSKKEYSTPNWYKHAESCANKPKTLKAAAAKRTRDAAHAPAAGPSSHAPSLAPATASTPVAQAEKDVEMQTCNSLSTLTNALAKKSLYERKNALNSDSRITAVEPTRVKCGLCHRWIKLNNETDYATYNWYKHIKRCEEKKQLRDMAPPSVPVVIVKTESLEIEELAYPPQTVSSRRRYTAEERITRLKNDARIKTIEPHRVLCGLCDRWIKLQNKTEYDAHNWLTHVNKCQAKHLQAPTSVPQTIPTVVFSPKKGDGPVDSCDIDDPFSSVSKRGNSSCDGYQESLRADKRCLAVEPHRILCSFCKQWIKLRIEKEYVPYNWYKHVKSCETNHGGSIVSSPAMTLDRQIVYAPKVKVEPISLDLSLSSRKKTEEEREALLLADPRQSGVERGRVFCRMCNTWIRLNSANGFQPTNFLRHATRCQKKTGWRGDAPSTVVVPPELLPVEFIDLIEEDGNNTSSNGVFGSVELGRLVDAFEPSVSSTNFVIKSTETRGERKTAPQLTYNVPTLRARTSRMSFSAKALVSPESSKRVHRTEELRKAELEADPRTEIVLRDKILCALCGKWIQMRRDVAYSPQNWLKHAGLCESRPERHQDAIPADDLPDNVPVVKNEGDDVSLPYNARLIRAEIDAPPAAAPAFKPVDWQQEVIYSDDEGEECVLVPGIGASSSSSRDKHPSVEVKVKVKKETQIIDLTANDEKGKSVVGLPTPLTFLGAPRRNKTNDEPKKFRKNAKSQSKSPPLTQPFTTLPLARPLSGLTPLSSVLGMRPYPVLIPIPKVYTPNVPHAAPSPFTVIPNHAPTPAILPALSPALPPTSPPTPAPVPAPTSVPAAPLPISTPLSSILGMKASTWTAKKSTKPGFLVLRPPSRPEPAPEDGRAVQV